MARTGSHAALVHDSFQSSSIQMILGDCLWIMMHDVSRMYTLIQIWYLDMISKDVDAMICDCTIPLLTNRYDDSKHFLSLG